MTAPGSVLEPVLGRVVSAEEMALRNHAAKIVADAERAAIELHDQAKRSIREREANLRATARAEAQAEVAAFMLRLCAREQEMLESNRERIIELARLLAERVLGRALTECDETFRDFAEQALSEVRGARQVTILAGRRGVEVLSPYLTELRSRLPIDLLLSPSESLGPNELRFVTDIGQLDASLSTQLEHLVAGLREGLGT